MKQKLMITLVGALAVFSFQAHAQLLVVNPTVLDADWETGHWTSGYAEFSQARANFQLKKDGGSGLDLSEDYADRKDFLTFYATNEFARSGDYSVKFYSNPQPSGNDQPYRTEIAYFGSLTFDVGDELYYSASYRPGANWGTGPKTWTTVISQWKIAGGGRPAFSLGMSNDGNHNISLARAYYNGGSVEVDYTPLGTLPLEEWSDFVFYFKWSASSDGVAKIWKNGELIYDYSGITWYQSHLTLGYLQLGMYTQLEWDERTMHIDNVRIGDSMFTNGVPAFVTDPISGADATEGVAYSDSIAGSAADPDGDPLTYTKLSGPAWLQVASNGALSGTPGPGDVGLNVFSIRVADSDFGEDAATLEINVDTGSPGNQPPAFTTDPIVEVNGEENTAYSSTIADDASDPESDPMVFSKVSGPAWLSVATDGTLSGTPGAGDVGLNTFTVQVDATGGSDTATLNIPVDAAPGGPIADFPQGEATARGSITSGSIADLQSDNDIYEVLTEAESGGKPSNRRSELEHSWTFSITGGELVTFYVEAHHDANSEGDDFTFSYSTDNVNFTDMVTVTKTADDDTAQFYSLPGGLSGTVYVKVVDSDRTRGNRATDSLYVDFLSIVSESAAVPPGAASNPSPADGATGVDTAPSLTWSPGMMAASHDVYFGTSPNPAFQGNQAGASFSPGALNTSTTYYWAIDEINGAGTTIGPVWSFTTGSGTPEMHVDSIGLSTRQSGKKHKGVATVTIVDSGSGQPVAGAMVSGDFTGAFSESGSAATDASGVAVITTSAKAGLPFSFTFTVTDVAEAAYVYNEANNVETSDSGSF